MFLLTKGQDLADDVAGGSAGAVALGDGGNRNCVIYTHDD